MPAAPRPSHDWWCDIDSNPITLFCRVEQVEEDPEPTMLPSRLHQQGHVVGRGLDRFYVCFEGDQVVSVSPQLLRLIPDALDEYECPRVTGRGAARLKDWPDLVFLGPHRQKQTWKHG